MPQAIRLWQVNEQDRLQEIKQTSLDLEQRLHAWLEADISIISNDLLVIGSEVRTFYGGFIDLLCINSSGDLVVVELKRGLTPREVVAQTLDYASWVKELSREQVIDYADEYLNRKFNLHLEDAFQRQFNTELPEALNENHSLLVVASSFDKSSERIINYLSEDYGVNINALTFQYFNHESDQEFLGRVFLIEPSVVQRASQNKKGYKRKPNLTREELRNLSQENGVGKIYEKLVQGLLSEFFKKTNTTLSSLVFCGDYSLSRNAAILSLDVTDSNAEEGLLFRCFTMRFAEYMKVCEESMISCYPSNYQPWQYDHSGLPQWEGHKGYFTSTDDVENFLAKLAEVGKHGS
ncbi:hypothetical protein [Halomicronema sp. CCY15110]|uniref:hypothetical protein n=1 Tax=Halomicronema sp. CCY15110 TaxID=2767773 RepID=UPI00195011D7|nr:hypothetical protein [Halomicronema sp. CCY15110]